MAWLSCCRLLVLVILVSLVQWSGAQNVTRPEACGRNALCDCDFRLTRPLVSCHARSLTVVPAIYPYNIVVISLLQNDITQIYEDDFQGLEKVETLFLQQNKIEAIHPLAFRNMYKLELLVLHDNRLTTISADLFQHLPSLRRIDIQRNRISQISRYAFATLRNVTITLDMNPLSCDCEAWALKQWLEDSQASVRLNNAFCQPSKRPLLQLAQADVPNCGNSEKVYDPSLSCHTCLNAGSMRQCRDEGSIEPCHGSQNACTTELSMNNDYLVLVKRCQAVSTCLVGEWNNAQSCGVDQNSTSNFRCQFCCLGSRCNRPLNSSEGRTREMGFIVSFQLNLPQSANIGNAINNTGLIAASTMKALLMTTAYGGYHVIYQEARDPATTLVFTVQATVVNTPSVRRRDVRDAINATLQSRLANTFQGDVRVVPGSLQFGDLPDPDQGHVVGVCPQETQDTAYGSFVWPPTLVGQSARLDCPHGTWEPGFLATRTCAEGGEGPAWQKAFLQLCHFRSSTTQALQDLLNTRIDRNSAPGVTRTLANLTQAAQDFASDDVRLAVSVAGNLLQEPSVLQSRDLVSTLVGSFSDLTSVPVTVIRQAQDEDKSSNKLLAAIDVVGGQASLSEGSLVAVQPRLAVLAVPLSSSSPFPGLQLSASTRPDSSLQPGQVEVRNGTTGQEPDAATRTSIALPPSLLSPGSPASRVAFTVFQQDSLFAAIQSDDFETTTVTSTATSSDVITDTEQPSFVTRVNSHVIAASVPGVTVAQLREPVLISLSHRDQGGANPRCVFWDTARERWSSEGCRVNFTTSTHTLCACDHLTNFALVMDVYQTGGGLSEADQRALSIISYIGCGVSLLGLLLTLLTYMLFRCGGGHGGQDSNQGESGGSRKLRKDNPSKILINLCVALAAACVVFVLGQQPYTFASPGGCKAVGVLLHYFLLASLTWMAVQAFYMYLALVLVFNTYFAHFMLKCASVGWGVPLVVVAITLGINKTDNYGLIGENFCWLQTIPFYAAFVAPVLLILLLNFLAFGLVLRNLLGFSARKLTKSSDRTSLVTQLRGAIGIVILLGLTWIFAIFAIGGASVVFHYLFAIFNSLQGLFIFIFYCLLKKDARAQWRRLLPCCADSEDKSSSAATSSRGDSISAVSRHTVRQTINSDSDLRPRSQQSRFVNHRGEMYTPRQEGDPVATSDVRLEAFNKSSATSI